MTILIKLFEEEKSHNDIMAERNIKRNQEPLWKIKQKNKKPNNK